MPAFTGPEDVGMTLVLGGARSGKSRYAESLVTEQTRPWIYVATAEPRDHEMAVRIAEHKARRGAGWRTIEAPLDLSDAIGSAPGGATIMVDCLTLWLSNLMQTELEVYEATRQLEAALTAREGASVLVSNEVGMGLVPETPLGRAFRDAQGRLNQRMAAIATRVTFMVAGQPLLVKGPS